METTDLVLAIVHHLLVFSLAGIIGAEFVLIRNDLSPGRSSGSPASTATMASSPLLIIIVGIGRVFYGLKGWEFYVYNWVFWAKMAAFVVVGLLSILPDRALHVLEQAGGRRPRLRGAGGRTRLGERLYSAPRPSSSC